MHGVEWVVDAWGCSAEALRDTAVLKSLFEAIISDLKLRPIDPTIWQQFPGSGGITGLCLLTESHLACHTFPEHGSFCLNLFCCIPRAEWPFEAELHQRLGAGQVSVRCLIRSYEVTREAAADD